MIAGGEGGGKWLGGIDRQLRAHLLSPFVSQKLGTWISTEREEDLETLRELLEAGKVTPVVDRTYPLADVPEAIRYMRALTRAARSSSRCEEGHPFRGRAFPRSKALRVLTPLYSASRPRLRIRRCGRLGFVAGRVSVGCAWPP